MNKPQFKIHGAERRVEKKRLAELKSYMRTYWHYHQLDLDMCELLDCKTDNYPMSKDEAQKRYAEAQMEAWELEKELNVPYEESPN